MKKWLIFTMLKLIEIPLLVIVPYQVFMLIEDSPQNYHIFFRWLFGLCATGMIFIGIAIGVRGIWLLSKWNIKFANYIKHKIFGI